MSNRIGLLTKQPLGWVEGPLVNSTLKSALPARTVGILGGGQLGSMLAESILKYGGRVAVYDPSGDCPAFLRTPFQFVGSFSDKELLGEFFRFCDVVTYEFENVETGLLNGLSQDSKTPLWPSEQVLATTQNRISEKTFLQESGFPHAGFRGVETPVELDRRIENGPYPTIVKTARGGYDGKGQAFLKTKQEGRAFLAHLMAQTQNGNAGVQAFLPCVFEEVVDLWKEVSVIVARDAKGSATVFPVFENLHTHHILDFTLLPAQLSEHTQKAVAEVALLAAQKLDVVGLLTVEFFISQMPAPRSIGFESEGLSFYINEFAPRPHNSGHITRNACHMSQFDAHARVLLGIPLSPPTLVHPDKSFCMGNLLGDVWLAQGSESHLNLEAWLAHPEVVDVTLYGKATARAKRKMGHFVTREDTAEKAKMAAQKFRAALEKSRPAAES